MIVLSVAALFLAPGVTSPLQVARAIPAGREEFLWRRGYWYCALFSVNGRDTAIPRAIQRASVATLTVYRSEVAEGAILVSANGTIAELPQLFAARVAELNSDGKAVIPANVSCYHFASRRNLTARIDRHSGLGARKLLYRGEPLARVTEVVVVPGFAELAMPALRRWTPPQGSTIYGSTPCEAVGRTIAPAAVKEAPTCRPARR